MSVTSRKHPQTETSKKDVGFRIKYTNRKTMLQSKRRKRPTTERIFIQPYILLANAQFDGERECEEALNVEYNVLPKKRWLNMTSYKSFVLNKVRYELNTFVHVANSQSVERQETEVEEAAYNNDTSKGRRESKSKCDWVAFTLEIRASDEKHVFARVSWMYWPEELPEGTMDGERYPGGRQSYHGWNKLIASNHMDIINVISVTSQAHVGHWNEKDDEDVQKALYWRQALDCQTNGLSSLMRLCTCRQPANPDKTLIMCSNRKCAKWLHDDCLQEEAELRAYEGLVEEEPHLAGKSLADGAIPSITNERTECRKRMEDGRRRSFGLWKSRFTADRTIDSRIVTDTKPAKIEFKAFRGSIVDKVWTDSLRCISCGSIIP